MALFSVTISFEIDADHQGEAVSQAKEVGNLVVDDGYANSFAILDVEEMDDGSGVEFDETDE